METHAEHSKKARNAVPCTAQDLTFGGRCLACGYDPTSEPYIREAQRVAERMRRPICPECDAGDPTSIITECDCNTDS